jgi:hypothetical protein
MNKKTIPPVFVTILLAFAFTLGACSPVQIVAVPNPAQRVGWDTTNSDGTGANNDTFTTSDTASENSSSSTSDGMVAFDGNVFVASADLIAERWQAAGWQISQKPVNTDIQQIPSDCTLYPHEGVEGQWVGNCAGNVLIPRDGATHISVMHTARDGTTTMVQVAPPQ